MEESKHTEICVLSLRLIVHVGSENPKTDLNPHQMLCTCNSFVPPMWGLWELFAVRLELQRATAENKSALGASWLCRGG